MTAPNMAAITASLERSFQNCSLNHHDESPPAAASIPSDQRQNSTHLHPLIYSPNSSSSSTSSAVELNSDVSLPCHWEQCLDLKTGEIYYINWRNGMRANEDPRLTQEEDYFNGDHNYYYSSDDDDSSSCDSEESSSEFSPSSSRDHYSNNNNNSSIKVEEEVGSNEDVLVVGGCKRCLMYFMVPKQVASCPKCRATHLIHFDRSSDNNA
ncbi:Protein CURLY FLAG LEAF 1 [Linum perenne]